MEFNQVAMANSEGSEVMLNRVMTKDNIGVAVLLEVNKDMFSGGKNVCESSNNSCENSETVKLTGAVFPLRLELCKPKILQKQNGNRNT